MVKMGFSALGSGSSGNCFYVENDSSAVLIDAGISAKQIVERVSLINRAPEKIKAIFITHEHGDHIRGADVFARKFNIPIFATHKTINSSFLCTDSSLISPIKNNETISLAGLKISAFSKSHKSADPVSYNILNGNKHLSVITDLGFACENTITSISNADFLCLESNHDECLLEDGPYPYFLKKWIKGDTGHLSNKQCALSVLEHAKPSLSHLVLAHLSENNNTPKIALKTNKSLFKERTGFSPKISHSGKDIPTELIRI